MIRLLSALFRTVAPARALAALALAALFISSPAHAAGRVVWKTTTFTEKEGKGYWRLDLEIHLSKAPDVSWYPMKFEFEPTAYYERALMDGKEGPQERTVPLTGQQSLIESQDVGFLDAGTGKTQSRTKFTFKLTRAHGYEAGEYKVTIRDASTGSMIGTPTTLKFKGENEIIDRRAMVFQASDSKKKKKDEAAKQAAAEESQSESAPAEESPAPESSEPAPSEGAAPPPVEERPGGGCHHSGPHPEQTGWIVLLVGMGVLLARRRAA
jgi:hypothetical protein